MPLHVFHRQRRQRLGAGLAEDHGRERFAAQMSGQMGHPRRHQPAQAPAAVLHQAAALQQQAAALTGRVAPQAREPVVDGQRRLASLEGECQRFVRQRHRPSVARRLVLGEQVRHGGRQCLADARREGAHRQVTAPLEGRQPLAQGRFARLAGIHRDALRLDQFVLQLPVHETIEGERLLVEAHDVVFAQVHAQPLAQEDAHGLAGEFAQQAQRQRGLARQGRQSGVRAVLVRARLGSQAGAPLARIAEEPRHPAFEIGRVKRLQAMRHRERVDQRRPRLGRVVLAGEPPAGGQVVAQLRDQHRRRALLVVVDAAPDPAHMEVVARGEQGFEEQVAVVLAPRPVPGAVVARHQVEVHGDAAARIVAVVHAEQGDAAERDRAHGHERCERHAAREEGLVQPARLHALQPVFAHDGQRQRRAQVRLVAGLRPVVERVAQAQQGVALVAAALRQEEIVEQRLQALQPRGRRGGFAQLAPVRIEQVDQPHQGAQQRGVEPADLVQRLDALPGRPGAHGVAEQHALEPEGPRVLRQPGRQVELLALFGVQAPAHAGRFDPAVQQRQLRFVDAEALAQGRHLQQVQHVAHRHA